MEYRNPTPTVDIIIELEGERIVLIERGNEPFGFALPGGFVDDGESLETAARREALEETGLKVELTELLYVYSDPARDPRKHTLSVVYIGRAVGEPRAGDDARSVHTFHTKELPTKLAFDHRQILDDYLKFKQSGEKPRP